MNESEFFFFKQSIVILVAIFVLLDFTLNRKGIAGDELRLYSSHKSLFTHTHTYIQYTFGRHIRT